MADSFLSIKTKGISKDILTKKLDIFERKITPKIRSKMIEAMEYARTKIAECAPSTTGNLRKLIGDLPISNVRSRGVKLFMGRGTISVSLLLNRRKDELIRWIDQRTGIYGPFHRRIVPKTANALVFEIGGRTIAVRSVKGQKGKEFIKRGLNISKLIVAKKIASAFR